MLFASFIAIFDLVGCWFYCNIESCWLLVLFNWLLLLSQYLIVFLTCFIAIFNHMAVDFIAIFHHFGCWFYHNI